MDKYNPGKAGGGGVLRDSKGRWIKCFSIQIGIALNNIAKIWAIRYGLKMALELGYKHINLEIDSQILLNWLTTYGVLALEHFVLILDCRMLLGQERNVLPRHVFREAN